MDKVVVIVGPTASGKSSLAIEVAKKMNGEVISADSMQVYEGMDIGTAKITAEEMDGVVHHLIDVQPIDQPWNVMAFQQQCRQAIREIQSRGHLPIVCGGTGLYIKAALYDYEFEAQDHPDTMALQNRLEQLDNDQLVALLKERDPGSLDKIHPNNRKRLLRAALMSYGTKTKSQREQAQNHQPIYDVFLAGLQAPRPIEIERIDKRVDQMFEQGLPEEVSRLFGSEKSRSWNSFQGIGYKEFAGWLDGLEDLDSVREQIKIHTRQYARRQMTWFRKQMPVRWYDPAKKEEVLRDLEQWIG